MTWALPAYELALIARTTLDMQGGREVVVTVVTPEAAPLCVFGDEAGAALTELLSQRRIGLRTDARPEHVTGDVLWLDSGEAVLADAVLSLPRLEGPGVPGLPSDEHGFIPVDPYGRVTGADRVLAAGDATSFPVKQGGLATQQADTAAGTIAQRLGARAAPRPFAPGAARCTAHGRRPALPARGARRLRPSTGHAPAAAAEHRLVACAVVAAGQGRRPLPRALHGDRAAAGARRRAAGRISSGPEGAPPSGARPTAAG